MLLELTIFNALGHQLNLQFKSGEPSSAPQFLLAIIKISA
jgi:hypothetical protein